MLDGKMNLVDLFLLSANALAFDQASRAHAGDSTLRNQRASQLLFARLAQSFSLCPSLLALSSIHLARLKQ